MDHKFHIHLVSDSTGETLHAMTNAALAQFDRLAVAINTGTNPISWGDNFTHGRPGSATAVLRRRWQAAVSGCRGRARRGGARHGVALVRAGLVRADAAVAARHLLP